VSAVEERGTGPSRTGAIVSIAVLLLGVPALVVRFAGIELPVVAQTAVFGVGILGAAFVLGAAAEAGEHDLPPSLSLAILAFVAVLPEYAVDLLFAWRAGTDPSQAPYAVANMTGGNRLIVGLGWATVLAAFYFFRGGRVVQLPRSVSVEAATLALATVYAITIPIKGSISLVDSVVLISLLVFYLYRVSRQPRGEPEAEGPVAFVADLSPWRRRGVVAALFVYAAGVILASSEPFADGLIATGTQFGIDRFLLVQWIAPLASESPEFLAATYLVWRGNASGGLTALISSLVNQWTLLIGSLAIAFAISGHTLAGLPMDGRQREEVLLTAAQSFFALMLIADRRLSPQAAIPLGGLFIVQLAFPSQHVRLGLSAMYFALGAGLLVWRPSDMVAVLRDGIFGSPLEDGLSPAEADP
jgi:cation:H+ antiporter